MREFILIAGMTLASLLCFADNTTSTVVSNSVNSYVTVTETPELANVEVVNDSTIVYTNVDRIEIAQKSNCIVYIFDKDTSKLVAANRGSFVVDLPKGDYLVVSTKPFTSVHAKEIVEHITY